MNQNQYYGTGRRKTASARVYMRPGAGHVKVNGRTLDEYFPNEVLKMVIKQPLQLTETVESFMGSMRKCSMSFLTTRALSS